MRTRSLVPEDDDQTVATDAATRGGWQEDDHSTYTNDERKPPAR
ncbi:MAG: hypothetical protein ACJAQ0_001696 [Dasania sp.]|jgi:hypothetical protein